MIRPTSMMVMVGGRGAMGKYEKQAEFSVFGLFFSVTALEMRNMHPYSDRRKPYLYHGLGKA